METSARPPRLREEFESGVGVGDADSVAVSVAAIDLDIQLVDLDVRKVLAALHGEAKYAGNSASSPRGKAFLEKELESLMVAKARYKEKKLARLQLQRSLPVVAVDWEIHRVDAQVREVLEALQHGILKDGKRKEDLEERLHALMAEKAQLKERRLSLLQEEEKDPQDSGDPQSPQPVAEKEPAEAETAAEAIAAAEGAPATEAPVIEAPAAAPAAAAAAAAAAATETEAASPSPSSSSTTPDDKLAVAATTTAWTHTVALGTYDAPRRTADLYAKDAILWGTEVCGPDDDLWGTVSETVRDTPEQIYAYFDYFARLPELKVVEFAPAPVRVYGDVAAQAGSYTFSWQGTEGATVEMRSRFSFTYRRNTSPGTSKPWTIVEHHSSSMPTSPEELELVRVGSHPGMGVADASHTAAEQTRAKSAAAAVPNGGGQAAGAAAGAGAKGATHKPMRFGLDLFRGASARGLFSSFSPATSSASSQHPGEAAPAGAAAAPAATAAEAGEVAKAEAAAAAAEAAVAAAEEEAKKVAAEKADADAAAEAARVEAAAKEAKEAKEAEEAKAKAKAKAAVTTEAAAEAARVAAAAAESTKAAAEEATVAAEATAEAIEAAAAATAAAAAKGAPAVARTLSFEGADASTNGSKDTKDPNIHDITATVGPLGLGLQLGEEKEGTRWVIKGFRVMPDGKPNPSKMAGIKVGDTLQKLGGVPLGSYKDGIEMFKKQRGDVVLTILRQIGAS